MIACTACGSRNVIAVRPGSDAVYAPVTRGAVTTGNVVGTIESPATPDVAWCATCWPGPVQGVLFDRVAVRS